MHTASIKVSFPIFADLKPRATSILSRLTIPRRRLRALTVVRFTLEIGRDSIARRKCLFERFVE
jgi:hypothetical protein